MYYYINWTFKIPDQLIAGCNILSKPAEEFDNDVSSRHNLRKKYLLRYRNKVILQ